MLRYFRAVEVASEYVDMETTQDMICPCYASDTKTTVLNAGDLPFHLLWTLLHQVPWLSHTGSTKAETTAQAHTGLSSSPEAGLAFHIWDICVISR